MSRPNSSRPVRGFSQARWTVVIMGILTLVPHSASALGVFWSSGAFTIGGANLDGTAVNGSFISGVLPNVPAGIAVDATHIYWAAFDPVGAIGRANLDGSDVDQTLIPDITSPVGIAVDATHIFWTNDYNGTIGRANLDGTGVNQAFITGASVPLGMAVDSKFIYWVNQATGTIGRANLNGTGVNENFITGVGIPTSVVVNGSFIYWVNLEFNLIGRANLDGTDVNQSFITAGSTLSGVAIDGLFIYWGNQGTDAIGRAKLDGTDVNQSFITGAIEPYFLAAIPEPETGLLVALGSLGLSVCGLLRASAQGRHAGPSPRDRTDQNQRREPEWQGCQAPAHAPSRRNCEAPDRGLRDANRRELERDSSPGGASRTRLSIGQSPRTTAEL